MDSLDIVNSVHSVNCESNVSRTAKSISIWYIYFYLLCPFVFLFPVLFLLSRNSSFFFCILYLKGIWAARVYFRRNNNLILKGKCNRIGRCDFIVYTYMAQVVARHCHAEKSEQKVSQFFKYISHDPNLNLEILDKSKQTSHIIPISAPPIQNMWKLWSIFVGVEYLIIGNINFVLFQRKIKFP